MDEIRRLIRVRTRHNKPAFKRRGLHRKARLEDVWRRPRGLQSKQRAQFKAKGAHPRPGYGSPVTIRGMHPSGYEEVRAMELGLKVLNAKDLTRAAEAPVAETEEEVTEDE